MTHLLSRVERLEERLDSLTRRFDRFMTDQVAFDQALTAFSDGQLELDAAISAIITKAQGAGVDLSAEAATIASLRADQQTQLANIQTALGAPVLGPTPGASEPPTPDPTPADPAPQPDPGAPA